MLLKKKYIICLNILYINKTVVYNECLFKIKVLFKINKTGCVCKESEYKINYIYNINR